MKNSFENRVLLRLFYFDKDEEICPCVGAKVHLEKKNKFCLLGTSDDFGYFLFPFSKSNGVIKLKITLNGFADCFAYLYLEENKQNEFDLQLEKIRKKYKNQTLKYYIYNGSSFGMKQSE